MLLVVGNAATVDGLISVEATPSSHDVGLITAIAGGDRLWLPGGSAAAIAIAASRYGTVRLWHPLPRSNPNPSVIQELFERFDQFGVDYSHCPLASDPVHALVVDAPTGRLCWSEPPADVSIEGDLSALFDGITHVVFAPRWGSWSERVFEHAVRVGVPVSFVGEVPPISNVEWTFAIADARQLADNAPVAFATVATSGAAGSEVITEAGSTRIPSVHVEAIDTTGAGDAFGGAFIGAAIAGEALIKAAEAAAAAGAIACTHWGALPTQLPSHAAR